MRRLFPGLLGLSLGTVESTVRAPGRVSYGFRVDALSRESFRVYGDTIEMDVPPVKVYSVEPAPNAMEVSTTPPAGSACARARRARSSSSRPRS